MQWRVISWGRAMCVAAGPGIRDFFFFPVEYTLMSKASMSSQWDAITTKKCLDKNSNAQFDIVRVVFNWHFLFHAEDNYLHIGSMWLNMPYILQDVAETDGWQSLHRDGFWPGGNKGQVAGLPWRFHWPFQTGVWHCCPHNQQPIPHECLYRLSLIKNHSGYPLCTCLFSLLLHVN